MIDDLIGISQISDIFDIFTSEIPAEHEQQLAFGDGAGTGLVAQQTRQSDSVRIVVFQHHLGLKGIKPLEP